jgi:hypothetical protein
MSVNDVKWWWSVVLQPRPGLGLPYGFHDSFYSTMWGYQLHDRPVLDTLIQPSETTSSHYQRLSWWSRETRVRNGPWILPTSTYHARRVLLHAINLRHGTNGFTSPPKEGVLQILSPLKNPSSSAAFEPANLGSSGKHSNHYTTLHHWGRQDRTVSKSYLFTIPK